MEFTHYHMPEEGEPILIYGPDCQLTLTRYHSTNAVRADPLWRQWQTCSPAAYRATFQTWLPMSEDTAQAAGL